jgi:hypothetical protein
MPNRIDVALEHSPKKTFATAVDWPGWSRSGRTEEDALEALRSYATRYAPVAARAGEAFPGPEVGLRVIERNEGGGATAFGVPSLVTSADRRRTTAADADRLVRLVEAAWAHLDEIAAASPEALRKGPRGGGRDKSRILAHVVGADHGYAREIGVKVPEPAPDDRAAVDALRRTVLEVLRTPTDGSPLAGRRWTARYAAHRIAWHALDHAWEIEDRREPAQ